MIKRVDRSDGGIRVLVEARDHNKRGEIDRIWSEIFRKLSCDSISKSIVDELIFMLLMIV